MSFIEHNCLMSLAITYVNREIKNKMKQKSIKNCQIFKPLLPIFQYHVAYVAGHK